MTKILIAALALVFASSLHARCFELVHDGFYADVFVGGNYVDAIKKTARHSARRGHKAKHNHLRFNTGLFVDATVGRTFNGLWRLEEEAAYRTNTLKSIKVPGGHNKSSKGRYQVFSLMTNLYIDLPLCTPIFIKPYLGVGIGVAFNNLKLGGQHKAPKFPFTKAQKDYEGSSTNFAWQGIIGFTHQMSLCWDFIGEYRYFRTSLKRSHSHAVDHHSFSIGLKRCF